MKAIAWLTKPIDVIMKGEAIGVVSDFIAQFRKHQLHPFSFINYAGKLNCKY